MSALRRCSAGVAGLAAALGISSCNAIFGIEEGVLAPASGQGGSAAEELRPAASAGSEGMLASAASGPGGQGRSGAAATSSSAGAAGSGPTQTPAGAAGSQGSIPDAAVTPADPALPPGFTLVSDPVLFTGRNFSHALGVSGRLGYTSSSLGVMIEPNCTVDPSCFAGNTGDSFCVRGSVSQVVNDDFENAWGVNLQLNLAEDSWDRAGGQVQGISFKLTGPTLPSLRFHVTRPPQGEQVFPNYCQELKPVDGARVDVFFDGLKADCWDTEATEALPAEPPLSSLAWQIDAIADAAKPFDLCVSELRPIVRSD